MNNPEFQQLTSILGNCDASETLSKEIMRLLAGIHDKLSKMISDKDSIDCGSEYLEEIQASLKDTPIELSKILKKLREVDGKIS